MGQEVALGADGFWRTTVLVLVPSERLRLYIIGSFGKALQALQWLYILVGEGGEVKAHKELLNEVNLYD